MRGKRFIWLAVIALLTGLLPFAGAGAASAHSYVRVGPSSMHGWAFYQETAGAATGTFVAGPGVPPLGSGSARLTVDSTAGYILYLPAYGGTYFRDITALRYSTYRTSGAPALAIALQFNVDYDLTDTNTAWQGRLVFEPYMSGTPVTPGVWQTWDPMLGKWWATGNPGKTLCPQSAPCTWAQVLANWPNAGVSATQGVVLFKAGGGWTGGFDGNVDAFMIGVKGDTTVYNFEPNGKSKKCKDDDSKGNHKSTSDDDKDHRGAAACGDKDDHHGKKHDNDRHKGDDAHDTADD